MKASAGAYVCSRARDKRAKQSDFRKFKDEPRSVSDVRATPPDEKHGNCCSGSDPCQCVGWCTGGALFPPSRACFLLAKTR